MHLTQHPCRGRCSWSPQRRQPASLALFRCRGCGSQWDRTQGWTPMNADGTIIPEVRAELDRRPTSARGAGGADSAGS